MLITRIKAKNFKTYLNLDLDISVKQDMPIILIGGANGGGKTTLFESIYGALYGLNIRNAKQFNELNNAGANGTEDDKIVLELHFTGKVLNEEHRYVLTRTYILNSDKEPVESVKLNLNGTIFSYGTATPISQRIEQEAQVNKIIKANLPQELSRYFLFDAMEAGNLLKEDQLNRVIKENIENVMGFNKYILLSKSAENLFQSFTAQKLQLENEKDEYSQLLTDKKKNEDIVLQLQNSLNTAIQYSLANKELYDNLKSGLNQDAKISNKIEQTKSQIENIQNKENIFYSDLDSYIKDFELNVCLPKLLEAINSELKLIIQIKNQKQENGDSNILPENIEAISAKIIKYLKENNLILKDITTTELVDYIISTSTNGADKDEYNFLEFSDTKALENLFSFRTNNVFPNLNQQKNELDVSINQIPSFLSQIQTMEEQITGSDYALLKAFEDNELSIQDFEKSINDLRSEIVKIESKLHEYDIQTSQDPDPKYETLGRLKSFFEDVANQLLKVKKQQIEIKMKQDLNINLAAYHDVIDRVELSEDLKDLTFKIFHKSGNEIYLNQLNTASKQVVIQVLLKSLHEFGDYDPPVMIDTVMGVLDETSRATVLENYFPELSQQTILLSSDSEIRIGKDLDKIKPFISKTYTLKRDREKQSTEVISGYFGVNIND